MKKTTAAMVGLLAMACIAACGGDDVTGSGITCSVGQMLGPAEACSAGEGNTFEVMPDGIGCLIEADGISRICSNNDVAKGGFAASNIEDTPDWRIDSVP